MVIYASYLFMRKERREKSINYMTLHKTTRYNVATNQSNGTVIYGELEAKLLTEFSSSLCCFKQSCGKQTSDSCMANGLG